MTAIARTATGVEGALLIAPNGALITSASMMFGEMRMFLVPPEDKRWVRLDGNEIDAKRFPRLVNALGDNKKLPKIDHTWVYAG
jgi:hypothetical protein